MSFIDHGFRGIGIVQPVSDSGHRIRGLAIGNGFHCAAVGVSADDNIRHAKCDNRVFNRSGYTTRFRPERGDDITGVADNEKLSRLLLSNEFWYQTAIGTGDEKRFRILAGCRAAEKFLALRKISFGS